MTFTSIRSITGLGVGPHLPRNQFVAARFASIPAQYRYPRRSVQHAWAVMSALIAASAPTDHHGPSGSSIAMASRTAKSTQTTASTFGQRETESRQSDSESASRTATE